MRDELLYESEGTSVVGKRHVLNQKNDAARACVLGRVKSSTITRLRHVQPRLPEERQHSLVIPRAMSSRKMNGHIVTTTVVTAAKTTGSYGICKAQSHLVGI